MRVCSVYKISVVMPTFNEERNIANAIQDFKSLSCVDEIIVVDNNSQDRSGILARNAGAKVVLESRQGYGSAIIRGLKEASGDIIVIVEPDGSFEARDLPKFLAYIGDVDMVLGSRVYKRFIHPGAKMHFFLRYGNIFLAKLLAIQFRENLTDAGCTYRAIKRDALEKIVHRLDVKGSHFSPHMIMEALKAGLSIVEIPINYKARIGESKITYNFIKSTEVGLRMLILILSRGVIK